MSGLARSGASARLAAALLAVWNGPGTGSPHASDPGPAWIEEPGSVLRSARGFLREGDDDPYSKKPTAGLRLAHWGCPREDFLSVQEAGAMVGHGLSGTGWPDLVVAIGSEETTRRRALLLGRLVRLCRPARVTLALVLPAGGASGGKAPLVYSVPDLYRTVSAAGGAEVHTARLMALDPTRVGGKNLAEAATILQRARGRN